MMNYATRGKEKTHAEVFTPAGIAFFMVMNPDVRDVLTDVDKTILDPAVGQGQFPCAELVLKLFCNVDHLDEELALRALKSLYGIDIQESSVMEAREHLLRTLCDSFHFFTGKDFTRLAEAQTIVNENIICGDSLKLMEQWTNPQGSLF
ncbi:MAG: hypothetical protein IJG80_09435 [Selenomonadaceae bacterium]|nr:hypothetical protein [Selenomonadaceae bacterium]MBQ3433724.1 hypothetical protein [Selenomonadaceae bacterium]